ncbi:Uncharacterised protein [Vibrio cholerae]|nr:Uncharacterised protein [Vibrio cholerae]
MAEPSIFFRKVASSHSNNTTKSALLRLCRR